MTIKRYTANHEGQTAAFATPEPRNIAFENGGFTVRTGDDYIPLPVLTQDEVDAQNARTHVKLAALASMTPDQVDAWVRANVTNLTQAQDAIATLAVAVSVLARRI